MFGGVGVGRVDGLVETVGQHDGRLGAGQRRVDTLGVLGTRHAVLEALLHLVGNLGGVGEQHGTGELIVLGLADEVGGQQARVGGFVGDDADFGGAGNRVMPTNAETSDLAVATKMLPGPVILSTGSHRMSPSCGSLPLAPYANMAMA